MQICESLSSTRGVRRKGRSSPNLLHKTTVAACLRHDAPSHCLHWCKMQNADIRFASLQTFANPARPYPDYKLRLLTHKKKIHRQVIFNTAPLQNLHRAHRIKHMDRERNDVTQGTTAPMHDAIGMHDATQQPVAWNLSSSVWNYAIINAPTALQFTTKELQATVLSSAHPGMYTPRPSVAICSETEIETLNRRPKL